MSTNMEDERRHTTDQPDEEAPDDDATLEWPEPLSSEERSRIEAKTWNWDAVKIYPGGKGPGVPFSTYVKDTAPEDVPTEAADDGAVDTDGADALDNEAPESVGLCQCERSTYAS